MTAFRRVIRLALGHKANCILAVACAVGVAVLWGGNISAVYPLVEMVLDGQDTHEWLDEEIDNIQRAIAEHEAGGPSLDGQEDEDEERLAAEREALEFYQSLRPWVARYAPHGPFATLAAVCLLLLVGTLLKDSLRTIGQVLVARLAHLSALELRKEFYRRTLRLDLARFDEKGRGDLMTRFTSDLHYVTVGVQTLFGQAVREPLKALACLAGAAWISWRLLLITMLVLPLGGYLIHRLSKLLKRANRRALEELSGIYDTLSETFNGMKLIKAFTMEAHERGRFHQSAKQYYRKSMKIARYDALVSPVTELMGMGMIILAILAGGYLAINHQTHLLGIPISERPLDRGSLMLFYAFLAGVSDPARRLSNVFGALQQSVAASERVYELLDREPSIADPPQPQPLPLRPQVLRFEGVRFAYRPDAPVLEGIELSIRAGETVAFVGPNGCGKTTLLNLVPRLYDPTAGCVTLDGIDIRGVRLRDLRERIGIVSQETLLFNDTVAANIRYGSLAASNAAIEAAAEQAHAHKFITTKLPDGYATVVGPGGNRLSGGQRQRIALARAILRDPQILILDEATSQVDLQSERLIHAVLREFIRGRTTLIITHRPSTLALADRVVVLQSGRILDCGALAELSSRCELFRHLCQSDLKASA
jgi:ATP-binding cassette subfamily B protein/subfamily B ATP-binding cassette protein MsbA